MDQMTKGLLVLFTLGTAACNSDDNSAPDESPNEPRELTLELGNDFSVKPATPVAFEIDSLTYEGDTPSFNWSQTSGATVMISNVNSSTLEFTSPAPSTSPLQFKLTVTDSFNQTIEDTISIDVIHEMPLNYYTQSENYFHSDGSLYYCEKFAPLEGLHWVYPEDDGLCFTADDKIDHNSFEVETLNQTFMSFYLIQHFTYDENPETCKLFYDVLEDSLWTSYSTRKGDCTANNLDFTTGHANISETTLIDGYPQIDKDMERQEDNTINIARYYRYEYDSENQLTKIEEMDLGPDEEIQTSDDIISERTGYYYDNEGYLNYTIYFQNIDPDEIGSITFYRHGDDGLLTEKFSYSDPGDDQDWLTEEDNLLSSHAKLERFNLYPVESLGQIFE